MLIIRKEINKERLLALVFFLPQVNYYISELLSSYMLPTISMYVYLLIGILGTITYFRYIKYRVPFIVTWFMSISLVFSVCFHPEVWSYMTYGSLLINPLVFFFVNYLPIFILISSGINLRNFFKIATKLSAIIIFLALVTFVNDNFITRRGLSDYMSFAYMLLNPLFFCFMVQVHNSKFLNALSWIGCFIIAIGGCRGALLTLAVYLILSVLFVSPKTMEVKAYIKRTAIVIGVVIFFIFFDKVFNFIDEVLTKFGYSSRVLSFFTSFLSGNDGISSVLEQDGRGLIWSEAFENFNAFGYGLFGDRTVLYEPNNPVVYAHNWILEIVLSYGVILGIVLVFFILYYISKSFIVSIRLKDRLVISMMISAVSILMVKHMLSASFMTSLDFWFYFGLSVSIARGTYSIQWYDVNQLGENSV